MFSSKEKDYYRSLLIDAIKNSPLNEGQQKSKIYRFGTRYKKITGHKSICMFEDCSHHAIGSHSFQESGCLDAISEIVPKTGNSVYEPIFNPDLEGVEFCPQSIRGASVFQGFCQQHENIFQSFEGKKFLETKYDFFLQNYRSLCFSIKKLTEIRMLNVEQLDNVNSEIKKNSLESIRKKLHNIEKVEDIILFCSNELENSKFTNKMSQIILNFNYIITSHIERLTYLKNSMEHFIKIGPDSEKILSDNFFIFYRDIGSHMDLCLSGTSIRNRKFLYAPNHPHKYIVNSFPNQGSQVFSALSPLDSKYYIESEFISPINAMENNSVLIKQFMEKISFSECDNIFISPRIFKKLTSDDKTIIARNFGREYDNSHFPVLLK